MIVLYDKQMKSLFEKNDKRHFQKNEMLYNICYSPHIARSEP